MAENHMAGRMAMGQVRKAVLIEVSGGQFKQQTLQEAGRLIWLAERD